MNASDPGTLVRAGRSDVAAGRPALLAATGAAFALVAALIGIDVAGDSRAGASWAHVGTELALLVIAVVAAGFLWGRFMALRRRARLLVRDLDAAQAEATRWRREADDVLRGLGVAIDRQFERWGLSTAEREVGLLLLKGLSLKELAGVRGTSERTARQQALAVYRKAGLSGRAELSAFFLEDLLLPDRPPAGPARPS